jgi:hypothetical protein
VHRRARERLVRGAELGEAHRLGREVRAPQAPCEADREHHPENAHRVADRISDDRAGERLIRRGLLERLDRGSESGRVGGGAREEPRAVSAVEPEDPLRHGGEERRDRDAADGEQVVAEPVAADRRDEGAPRGEPDRIDEDREAEHVDDLGEREGWVEAARGQADEQDRGDAELAAAHFDAARG